MKKKLILLAALLLALVVILPACHTPLIGLATRNNTGCTIPGVTYQVPGFGLPVSNAGPHALTHTNVGNGATTGYGDLGAGFGPNFQITYAIQSGSCYTGGTGTIDGIAPGSNWIITWSVGGGVATATASAQ